MTTSAEQDIERLIAQKRAEIAHLEQTLQMLRRPSEDATLPVGPRRGPRTRQVLQLLAGAGEGGMTRRELAAELGDSGQEDLLSNGLSYLKRAGKVLRTDDGRWHLPA